MIEDILPKYQETANGTKTIFTVPFTVIDPSYIIVYIGQEKQTSGYSVNGQDISFESAPEANVLVTIVRVIPISWEEYDYGALDKNSLDNIITLVLAKMQTLEEEVSRSLKTNIYDKPDGGQVTEFFLKQLSDARTVLESAQDSLSLITSTSNSAITNINDAKDVALQAIEEQVTVAENAASSAEESATLAQNTVNTAIDTINDTRDDAINTFNSNALTQTTAFNSNVTNKTDTFNENVTAKTTAFNTNAQNKQDAIDASVTAAAGSANSAAESANLAAASATVAASIIPSQTGNSGKYLTTDGTTTSWEEVDALPSQTGNSGKYLTTDGTTTSWEDLPSSTIGLVYWDEE